MELAFPTHQACRSLTEGVAQVATELCRSVRARRLRAGETLYREGGPTQTAFLVVRGRVRTLAAGRIESFGEGELVGELCFCAVRARQETAVALQATEVAELSPADLLRAVRSDEVLARNLLSSLCDRLGAARALAGEEQLAPAPARLGRRLLALAAAEGVRDGAAFVVVRRPTHAELSRAALISRERASKVLALLRREGCVEYGRTGPLRVVPARLRAWLQRL